MDPYHLKVINLEQIYKVSTKYYIHIPNIHQRQNLITMDKTVYFNLCTSQSKEGLLKRLKLIFTCTHGIFFLIKYFFFHFVKHLLACSSEWFNLWTLTRLIGEISPS